MRANASFLKAAAQNHRPFKQGVVDDRGPPIFFFESPSGVAALCLILSRMLLLSPWRAGIEEEPRPQ
jgi:hypothetical protein